MSEGRGPLHRRFFAALQKEVYQWRAFHLIMSSKWRPSLKLHWRSKWVWFVAIKLVFYYFLYKSIYSLEIKEKGSKEGTSLGSSARPNTGSAEASRNTDAIL